MGKIFEQTLHQKKIQTGQRKMQKDTIKITREMQIKVKKAIIRMTKIEKTVHTGSSNTGICAQGQTIK